MELVQTGIVGTAFTETWQSHHMLHAFMIERGELAPTRRLIAPRSFTLLLTGEDIEVLSDALAAGHLPLDRQQGAPTTEQQRNATILYRNEDAKFVKTARMRGARGDSILYIANIEGPK